MNATKMEEDRPVSVVPVYYSNVLEPHIQLHQYPLLNRPLEIPPSAAASGKNIRARVKPGVRRLEVHIPVDTRPEVWNQEKAKEFGSARVADDKEKNQDQESLQKGKQREGEEPRLSEVRMRSEPVPHNGAYVLGVLRNGKLHLHPISETHQLRPTLTYMDTLSRKSRRKGGAISDEDEDEGPPPDPDEPPPALPVKKEKKPIPESREVQVSIRKSVDEKGMPLGGGITAVRREMLMQMRAEEDEKWDDYEFHEAQDLETEPIYESMLASRDEVLECTTDITSVLKNIRGL